MTKTVSKDLGKLLEKSKSILEIVKEKLEILKTNERQTKMVYKVHIANMYYAGVFLCGTLSERYDAIDNLPHASH